MQRIIVWGGCGHGKTTFAKKISNSLNIPAYDLDKVTFNKEFTSKVQDDSRDKRLRKIIEKPRWIIEGAYAGNWIYPAIKKAEMIVIININPAVATKRVIFRSIKRKIRKTEDKGGPLFDLPRIIKYAYKYTHDYYPKHIKLAKKFKKDFAILKNKNQMREFIDNLKCKS